MRVSIIYLTKNGGELLKQSIAAIYGQQTAFDFEVIAVDSGSTDGTLEFLRTLPVRLYQIPPNEFNFGLTRDYGFELAQGEFVVAISQDAVPVGNDWLENLIEPFSDPLVAIVQGADTIPPDRNLFYWDNISFFYYTRDCVKWRRLYNNIGVSFTSCAIRKGVWEQNRLGRIEMSEDKVFQKMVVEKGYKIVFQHKAKDYHSHSYTVSSLAKRSENEGIGWKQVGISYTIIDMALDLLNVKVMILTVIGLITFKIRSLSEMMFPVIRPVYLFKGNNFTRLYVK